MDSRKIKLNTAPSSATSLSQPSTSYAQQSKQAPAPASVQPQYISAAPYSQPQSHMSTSSAIIAQQPVAETVSRSRVSAPEPKADAAGGPRPVPRQNFNSNVCFFPYLHMLSFMARVLGSGAL